MTEAQKERIAEFLLRIEQATNEEDLVAIRDDLVGSMKPRHGVHEASYTAACGHVIIAIHDRLTQLNGS